MNKAKYLFNTYEQSKILTPRAKPKPKFIMTSLRAQVIFDLLSFVVFLFF